MRFKLSDLISRLWPKSPPAVDESTYLATLPGGDHIVRGKQGPAMDEAMLLAKETLSVFWEWHETRSDDPNDCALKVGYPTMSGGVEYIWFIDILRTGNIVTGIVASEPEGIDGLTLWQPAQIDTAEIVDWTFRKDDLYYGHFTTRVLAASHPEVAARFGNKSETPLPTNLVRH